jgi:hypothetical protein
MCDFDHALLPARNQFMSGDQLDGAFNPNWFTGSASFSP